MSLHDEIQDTAAELFKLMSQSNATVLNIEFKSGDRIASGILYIGNGREANQIAIEIKRLARKIHQKNQSDE